MLLAPWTWREEGDDEEGSSGKKEIIGIEEEKKGGGSCGPLCLFILSRLPSSSSRTVATCDLLRRRNRSGLGTLPGSFSDYFPIFCLFFNDSGWLILCLHVVKWVCTGWRRYLDAISRWCVDGLRVEGSVLWKNLVVGWLGWWVGKLLLLLVNMCV